MSKVTPKVIKMHFYYIIVKANYIINLIIYNLLENV